MDKQPFNPQDQGVQSRWGNNPFTHNTKVGKQPNFYPSLSRYIVHVFHTITVSFYHHHIRKVQTSWCDPLVLQTTPKGQVLVTSSKGVHSLEKQPINNHLGEYEITHHHLGQLTKIHLVNWLGVYLQELLGPRPGSLYLQLQDLLGCCDQETVWSHTKIP